LRLEWKVPGQLLVAIFVILVQVLINSWTSWRSAWSQQVALLKGWHARKSIGASTVDGTKSLSYLPSPGAFDYLPSSGFQSKVVVNPVTVELTTSAKTSHTAAHMIPVLDHQHVHQPVVDPSIGPWPMMKTAFEYHPEGLRCNRWRCDRVC
jgi:hypothetical protein